MNASEVARQIRRMAEIRVWVYVAGTFTAVQISKAEARSLLRKLPQDQEVAQLVREFPSERTDKADPPGTRYPLMIIGTI